MDLKTLEKLGRKSADRREFLKKAGKAAATVPAVALLLSANATPAQAFGRYGRGGRGGEDRSRGHGNGHGNGNGNGHYRLQSSGGSRGFGHPPRGNSHGKP